MQTQPIPREHLTKARPPDNILFNYDHFIGEDEASKLRTHNWDNLRKWAREHPNGRFLVVLDTEF